MSSSLAASPDIGWPDAFNSGLLVLTPSLSTFSDIRDFAISRGSWDGADQGLLNDYFGGDEASGEIGRGGGWQRLPFRYNVTPNAGYT
jgi:glycogenin glucosyltransferase